MHACEKRLLAYSLPSQLVQCTSAKKILPASNLHLKPVQCMPARKRLLPSNLPLQPVQRPPMKKAYHLQPPLTACPKHTCEKRLLASNLPSQPFQCMIANKDYWPPTSPHSRSKARLRKKNTGLQPPLTTGPMYTCKKKDYQPPTSLYS